MGEKKGSLRRRIALAILFGMSFILLSYAAVSIYIVNTTIAKSQEHKLAMARLIRNRIDTVVQENINRLYDISLSGSVDFTDKNIEPERRALRIAYRYSIFRDGVFLLDRGGNIVLNYPDRIGERAVNLLGVEPIGRTVSMGKPVVSNLYTLNPSGRKVLYVLVPLRDRDGEFVGTAGGEIDPTNPLLTQMLKLVDLGEKGFIDIIDSNGMIIASSKASRTLTQIDHSRFLSSMMAEKQETVRRCHHCHDSGKKREKTNNVLLFVPLETAPWGVSVQESEDEVFAPALNLRKTFIALGILFLGTALVLTIGITRSIVNPINELADAADQISKGDMSHSVRVHGDDEIGVLSQSFESMRMKLLQSLESIRKHNLELESRVRERTIQIEESQERVKNLLEQVITTQEDERKRIARELHDMTLQDLSVILMKIDMCKLRPDQISGERVDEMRNITLKSLDGVVKIIQNLRPSLLDDLGMKSAIRWLLENHLKEKGVEYFFNIIGAEDVRFRPEVEITLFRIIQEAIMNIAKHAQAEHVFVILRVNDSSAFVDIEDDGAGFDFKSLLHQTMHSTKDRRGLGLLGMMERTSLIGGKFEICSAPGKGTRITVKFPLEFTEAEDA